MGTEADAHRMAGQTITALHATEKRFAVSTADGIAGFSAYGDCCSVTIFDSFIGADNIVGSKLVGIVNNDSGQETNFVPLVEPLAASDWYDDECVEHYELKVIADHPQFGEVTGVLSFRNFSNGYYGGSAEEVELSAADLGEMESLTGDVHRFGHDD